MSTPVEGTVTIDAAEYERLREAAALGVVDEARQLVAAAVSDGRIPSDRAKFWTQQLARHGSMAEATLAQLTPIATEAPDAAGPRWF
ncbi:hypothetical protein [Rhodococcus erythropolis]|uniref:hypothetical protein n=1 Tax=Rhodococcus erythropolis TaxID=1833 RepID=UPI00083F6CC8|nr:hypothetical protein [Rhodococcus erythropolis]